MNAQEQGGPDCAAESARSIEAMRAVPGHTPEAEAKLMRDATDKLLSRLIVGGGLSPREAALTVGAITEMVAMELGDGDAA